MGWGEKIRLNFLILTFPEQNTVRLICKCPLLITEKARVKAACCGAERLYLQIHRRLQSLSPVAKSLSEGNVELDLRNVEEKKNSL